MRSWQGWAEAYEHSPRHLLSPGLRAPCSRCKELSSSGVSRLWQSVPGAEDSPVHPEFARAIVSLESSLGFTGPSAIVCHRINEAGFHLGVIPEPCQRLSHSDRLGCIHSLLAGCQCQLRCSWPHVALTSPNRHQGWAQQAACAGGFHLRLWRANKRLGNRKPGNFSLKQDL